MKRIELYSCLNRIEYRIEAINRCNDDIQDFTNEHAYFFQITNQIKSMYELDLSF